MQSLLNVLLINLSQGHEAITLGERFVLAYSAWEYKIKIPKKNIQHFLKIKNIESEFFETTAKKEKIPTYLDVNHECYCPKLALAIDTHNYLVDNKDNCKTNKNHTIKLVALDYIKDNAYRFGIEKVKKTGELPEQLIQSIAMLVNFPEQKQEKQKMLETIQELSTSS